MTAAAAASNTGDNGDDGGPTAVAPSSISYLPLTVLLRRLTGRKAPSLPGLAVAVIRVAVIMDRRSPSARTSGDDAGAMIVTMPFNGKKSYLCDVGSCGQTFCTADKLNSHKKAHKVPFLVFSTHSPPQGPQPDDTPARFTKLMDAAGLAQDLSSNPFDESFRQAGQNPQAIELIDSDPIIPPPVNVVPPTTADILQQVVEQEQQPCWKSEPAGPPSNNHSNASNSTANSTAGSAANTDQRAPVITSRPGPTLLTDLTENGRPASIAAAPPGSSIGGLENVTVKTSSSPPPAHPSSAHGPGVPVNSSLLNQLNQVIVPPMLGMLQQAHVHVHSGGTTTLTDTLLSRHFSHIAQAMGHQSLQQSQSSASHDSASSTTTARGPQSMMMMVTPSSDLQIPNSSQHNSDTGRVGIKRKSGGGSSDDEEERKRKFRENNKRAAQRCRMRKKQEIEETRRERDRLREENQKLSAKLEHCMNTEDKLRAQLEKLKMELVEHAQCSVSLKKRNSGVIQYPV
ncbi:cyclic AMP-dependent transcription factor ATF-7-like isoform X1 [Varroa jacobsoni]|uniref:cyclic AMP-dependent transcription factor ATF-7-like isoform X1 n=1 Tax=Varroa jacobsoni TaxID=62625 RepID=UPI000BF27D90|nr:cyclic AMP-dependent transcription factor ATF-7-like isoform X1 [Varroa jacobsoni]